MVEDKPKKFNCGLWLIIGPAIASAVLIICLGLTLKFTYYDHRVETTCSIDKCEVLSDKCYNRGTPYVCYNWCLDISIMYENNRYNKTDVCAGFLIQNHPSWFHENICDQTSIKCYYDYKNNKGQFDFGIGDEYSPFVGGLLVVIISILLAVAILFLIIFTILYWWC